MTYQSSLETRCRMMSIAVAVCVTGVTGIAGCELAYEDELVRDDAWAVTSDNGLPQNGLPQNGLPQNGLPHNGLPQNGLPQNGLPQNGLPSSAVNDDWEDWLNDSSRGALNAQLMSYLVRCALSSSQSASYTDSASNTWVWDGEIGVATGWASGGLTAAEQRWVTSCVLSLVNGLGETVTISQRGASTSVYTVSLGELEEWDVDEGAFYGNMFASTPVYYSCNVIGMKVSMDGRICTGVDGSGNPLCDPIQPLGKCTDLCTSVTRTFSGEDYVIFEDCSDGIDTTYAEVTSTTLDF